ncbi:hypothetical protein M0812_21786 [Anaeramoeba flamelloides]|uniref:Uncharacterized protein n=1 Tax=Anaeramoeba flamelloides TaxID=1746091 RepID=A0AAV7YYL5_9EUKA|nr:hypothetical protein M0812_21786 [Anaeramoeba flamelloides]
MNQQNSFFSFQKLESSLKSIARNSIDLDNDLEEGAIFRKPNNVNLQRQPNKRLSQTIDFAYQSRNIETNKRSKLSMGLQKGNRTNQRIDPNRNKNNKKRSIQKVSDLLKSSNNRLRTKENRFLETKIQNKPNSQKGFYQKKNCQVPISSKKLLNANNNNEKKNHNNSNQAFNDSSKQQNISSVSFGECSVSDNENTKEEEINKKEKENTDSDREENIKGYKYSKDDEQKEEAEEEEDEKEESEDDDEYKDDDDDYDDDDDDDYDDDDDDEDDEDAELLNCILQNSSKNYENNRIKIEEKKISIQLLEKSLNNKQIQKPIFKIVKHRNAKTTIPMIEQLLMNPFLFDDEKEFQKIRSKRIESLIEKFYQKNPNQISQITTPTNNENKSSTQIPENQDPNEKFEPLNQQNSNINNIPTSKTSPTSTQNEDNKLIKSQENLNNVEPSPLKIGHEQWNKYVKYKKIQKNIHNAIPNIHEFIEITGLYKDEFQNTDLEESRKIQSNN